MNIGQALSSALSSTGLSSGSALGGLSSTNPLVMNATTGSVPPGSPDAPRSVADLRYPTASKSDVLNNAAAEIEVIAPVVERLEAKAASEGLTKAETQNLTFLKGQVQDAMNRYSLVSEGAYALRQSGLVDPEGPLSTQLVVAEAYRQGAQDLLAGSVTGRDGQALSVADAVGRMREAAGDEATARYLDSAIATASLKHVPLSVIDGKERALAVRHLGHGFGEAYHDATKPLQGEKPFFGLGMPKRTPAFDNAALAASVIEAAAKEGQHPADRRALSDGVLEGVGRQNAVEGFSSASGAVIGPMLGAAGRAARPAVREVAEEVGEAAAKRPLALPAGAESAKIARNSPGVATGSAQLKRVEGDWFRGSENQVARVPKQVAEALEGREFKNFKAFRSAFWKETAKHPELLDGMKNSDVKRMQKGLAPKVAEGQDFGGKNSYQLHHNTPIHRGGGVYNMENITVVTPRIHQVVLDPKVHFGGK